MEKAVRIVHERAERDLQLQSLATPLSCGDEKQSCVQRRSAASSKIFNLKLTMKRRLKSLKTVQHELRDCQYAKLKYSNAHQFSSKQKLYCILKV